MESEVVERFAFESASLSSIGWEAFPGSHSFGDLLPGRASVDFVSIRSALFGMGITFLV